MTIRRIATGVFAAAAFALPAAGGAQDDTQPLETVTVTGSRISYRDLLDTPAVAIRRSGDCLLLPITLVNDTRSEDGRKREIYATIEKRIASSGKRFELVHDDGYPVLLDARNHQVPLGKEEKRPDVSKVELSVRTAIGGEPSKAGELTRALRSFVDKAERVGRTEIDAGSETALSLTRLERFRYDLVKAIAEDTAKVRAPLGSGCRVSVDGLGNRIEWRRVSAAERLLYLRTT